VTGASGAMILKRFPEERYSAVFNPKSGFFARIEDQGAPEPFWSEHGPELLDVSLTNWCDRGCAFCYRASDQSGSHLALDDYRELVRQAHEMHAFQVALGGGNPNQHPDFAEILRLTREDFGIVPNYTTNGRGLSDEVLTATKRYCGAVAVSAYAPYREMADAVGRLVAHEITTNVHFVLSSASVKTASAWLREPPPFLADVHAIVFLTYKPVGRGAEERLLARQSPLIAEFFNLATHRPLPWRVGFDSCSITGLARFGNAESVGLEGCDAGRFSLFVSERLEVYPCSFMAKSGQAGASLRESRLLEIWRSHPAFTSIRSQHKTGRCSECVAREQCLGGCPVFSQIDYCVGNDSD
jgi:radical SAM protein with 4Fe4S-binding SPASM domain